MPQQSCLELPATICVLRTPMAMLSAHIHTIESGCKRLARRIRSTWEAHAMRQVVVSILDTNLRREQLFLLLAVGCSGLHPPQVREGYISRRAAAFDGENQIHLNFRGVGDWHLVPWGLSEVNMKAERDRMLSGKGMFWGPWGWTQVYPWVLALTSQPVPGPVNIPDAVLQPRQYVVPAQEQHWVYSWDRIRKQSVRVERSAFHSGCYPVSFGHHHSGPHSFPIIYPDLKTENLFLDSRGRTYITEHME
ncbi:hypothetical protein DFH08DRAFT_814742 [Mycena albidolilacea]|uniref:Uncharacterized protein n=1 Tax=Mycena albidolilacea TaxID=1033008 RepID=A0AAD7ELG9_9AGAR|nr:hypothetical protein DFH08DRAFT_814742 [Mycena albidolilacea]